MISGLRGAADVSGDGRVTLNEAYNFAFNETLQRTERTLSGAQHPAYDIQLAGTGDVVMTDLRDPSARLELPRDLAGRIYVRGKNGVLAAELTKRRGVAVMLALEPQSYRITVEQDSRYHQTQIDIAAGRTATLVPTLLAEVAGERTVLRGGVDDLKWIPVNLSLITSYRGGPRRCAGSRLAWFRTGAPRMRSGCSSLVGSTSCAKPKSACS